MESNPLQPRFTSDNLTTLQSHILAEEQLHPDATGDFSWIMSAVALAGKTIANKVRRARIEDVLGDHGDVNPHGERQQKLDVIANEIIMRCLGDRANIAVLASEEGEQPIVLRNREEGGRYCVMFDPLDGSSNLDVCVGVGTIFSILRNERRKPREMPHYLQPGYRQVAAGYILYGSSVVFVVTTGTGVDMFVLDQSIGAFVLVATKIRIPAARAIYSVNEAYSDHFPPAYREYLAFAHAEGYSSRYIGSMVADVHRTLLTGGVFLYPPTKTHRGGKLRLVYEANPMAMIIEQAGGRAIAGAARILDLAPTDLHERTSVVMGSPEEVAHVERFICREQSTV
ncbi:MAG: class 1 fructose-bisphosphatase [Phycisphaerales bacterium]|nr:class 1 fructose-bisphosphatase [Phycisphaerae bacterium]NNF44562.1 class 1 fructose-bisphosphatase [Phycisphaerales bacterium]NNM26294.1 class 1 fructose-bisphosphatase [Phycisphaerales bacterium]